MNEPKVIYDEDGIKINSYVEDGEPYRQFQYECGDYARWPEHTEEQKEEIKRLSLIMDQEQAANNLKAMEIYYANQNVSSVNYLFVVPFLLIISMVLLLISVII